MNHYASPRFWALYEALPSDIRDIADKNYQLLKSDPHHPSLHFKKIGDLWSVRVGAHYRALGTPDSTAVPRVPVSVDVRSVPMKMRFGIAFALLTLPVSAQSNGECSAKGEPIQWIADYCMLKMETDDEIAVSGCIDEESKKSFRNGCASNLHFKKSMCEVLVRAGTREGSVEQCVKDPTFKGRTVEAGGVGA